MRLLGHFLRRDFRDSVVGWTALAAVTLITIVFAKGIDNALVSAGERPRGLPMYVLGYLYLMFAIIHSSQIWGENIFGGQGLPRAYLLSLPVPRRQMFWISFARSTIGSLPLALFGVFAVSREFSRLSEAAVKFPMEFWRYYTWSITNIFVTLFFLQITTSTHSVNTLERIRKTSGRGRRLAMTVRHYFVTMIFDFLAFWGWLSPMIFFAHPNYAVTSWVFSFLCGAYFIARLRRNYLGWLFE